MKSDHDIRKAYRARYNRVMRNADALCVKMTTLDPDDILGTDIADLRDHVEKISQCFHEFNAYWNVAKT
jgi:hypothetical protein